MKADINNDLKSSRALITGASKGIGAAIAMRLVRAGADVVGLARSRGDSDVLEAQANQEGSGSFRLEACDVTDVGAVTAIVERLRRELGSIDILVNNVGIALGAPAVFWKQPLDVVRKVVGVNCMSLLNVTHSVLNEFMVPTGRGTILTISSVTGLEVPHKGMGEVAYHSTKAFTEGFADALRNELLGTDIRMLALRPGFVRTNFHFDRTGQDEEGFEAVFEGLEELQADDIAEMAIFMLAQPERMSVKALDIVPTAQRSLAQVDRNWTTRRASQH